MNVFDACAGIRMDAPGKKCPGGYSIPANKQCGKGGKGGKMKSPGGGKLGRNLAIGAAGLAVAGGGAAVAYKNRDRIVAGVDKTTADLSAKAIKAGKSIDKTAEKKSLPQVGGKAASLVHKAGKNLSKAAHSAKDFTEKQATKLSEAKKDLSSKWTRK